MQQARVRDRVKGVHYHEAALFPEKLDELFGLL
jgi:hypothetical protein